METIDLDQLRASVTKQGGIVRQLKKDGASPEEVTAGTYLYLICDNSCQNSSILIFLMGKLRFRDYTTWVKSQTDFSQFYKQCLEIFRRILYQGN